MFSRLPYDQLKSRQKENYNFHKVAGRLADYGFNCIRLSDDWQGADFIAVHVDGETFLKVQLKGRLVLDKKYFKKGIYIAFFHGTDLFLYEHDDLLNYVVRNNLIGEGSIGWQEKKARSWPAPPAWALAYLERFRIA